MVCYQPLSDKEIKALPVELKVCYYLHAWNKNINPQNFEEWFTYFFSMFDKSGILQDEYEQSMISREELIAFCKVKATKAYNKLYTFITKYL